jgi:hypothetical protein
MNSLVTPVSYRPNPATGQQVVEALKTAAPKGSSALADLYPEAGLQEASGNLHHDGEFA